MNEGLINVADFERVAAEKLEAGVLGYFAGGAGDEVTLRDNVAAWRRWRLRPRVLADVSEVTTAAEVLGGPVSMPLLVAPVAVLSSLVLGHPMPLVFDHFELGAILFAVLGVSFLCLDGESNWFEGATLIALYAIIAAAFWWG